MLTFKIFYLDFPFILSSLDRSFDRGLQYAKTTGNRYTDYQSVRRILEYPFTQ